MRPVPGGCLLALSLATGGCDKPVPPAVAVREPSLEADDLAIVRALLDDVRDKWRAASGTPPRFLVMNRTMAMCRRDPGVLGPQPGGCLTPDHANVLSEVVPAGVFPTIKLRFPSWNATAMSISGPLGDDVTYVSPTLLDIMRPSEILQRNPGSAVVVVSSPGYPAPGMAVIMFGSWWSVVGGAARLERQPDGRWRVVASISRSQD